ncbi:D-alanyl-D-alanine carboxypeptidase [Paracoccus contaminans]|uniref:D-alanyl-D-alanine carboxypeptidase/D-alanyl-D-alanine-endopeptidase n=1 Tax=Paracoccus contaminans TaxID=1945662 RepID=A0A1W6CZE8_9RHOB|nr:D-alanyl-D-alanine carboxypeptidase [Paracoccus contaminans]ARJ70237.1 hypothetical protein B0A89_11995 [Paracoccus contaminans]
MRRRGFLAGALAAVAAPAIADPAPRRPAPRPAPSPGALLAQARLGAARLAFAVMDPATGAVVMAQDGAQPMPPASTLKMVTALYALDQLGAQHRFATRVLRQGDTLVLAGGGDPELDTAALAALAADAVRAARGWTPARLAVWGGALPRAAQIAAGQDAQLAYNPAVSGMILNFNRVHLGWRCDSGCALTFEARGQGRSPRAFSIGGAVRAGGGSWRHQDGGQGEQWDIPRAALGRTGGRWLPVRLPEAYAGDVFQTLARAEGMALPAAEMLDRPPEGVEIARLDSRPLAQILRAMLEHSNNLTAEVVGLAASGAPDRAASAAAMGGWLAASGAGAALLADHSGLSADSRIAPETLVRLLARPDFAAALRPLLNVDPLREALGASSGGDGRGGAPLVSGKTGTLNFVSNLAGYAAAPGGADRVFAVMIADPPRRAATEGMDLPPGVLDWTGRAKRLQRDLVAAACRPPALPAQAPLPAEI